VRQRLPDLLRQFSTAVLIFLRRRKNRASISSCSRHSTRFPFLAGTFREIEPL
jgi:hypothetical protein